MADYLNDGRGLKPLVAALFDAGLVTLHAHRCASSVALACGLSGVMQRDPFGAWIKVEPKIG